MGKESPFFKDISQLIHFSEEEAYIIHQVIEGVDNNNLIKQNLKRKLASVYNNKIIAETIVKGQNADNIRMIMKAYEQKKQVILHGYSSAHGQTVADRLVEPFAFTTNYVEAWCFELSSGCNKLFKISRHCCPIKIQNSSLKYLKFSYRGFSSATISIDNFASHNKGCNE